MPVCLGHHGDFCIKERSNPLVLARGISWETLALVAGLFVMVDAIESIGTMRYTKEWLSWVQHLSVAAGSLLAGSQLAQPTLGEQSSAWPYGLGAPFMWRRPRGRSPKLF